MTGHERNKQSFNDIFSARDNSRRPIKSGINDECIGESADGTYSIYKNDSDKVFMFAENGRITKEVDYNDDEVDGVLENWIEIYDIKINPRYKSFVYNSRRPIKSSNNDLFNQIKDYLEGETAGKGVIRTMGNNLYFRSLIITVYKDGYVMRDDTHDKYFDGDTFEEFKDDYWEWVNPF